MSKVKKISVCKDGRTCEIDTGELKAWEDAGWSKFDAPEESATTEAYSGKPTPDRKPEKSAEDLLKEIAGNGEPVEDDLTEISGINDELASALVDKGIDTFVKMSEAPDEDMLSVSGIGKKKLASIKDALVEILA